MKIRFLLLTTLSLSVLALPAFANGGAWNRGRGSYYIRVGLVSVTASEEFDFNGDRQRIFSDTTSFRDGQFGMTDISFYGELGITDWLTGTASTQYRVAVREARYRETGRDTTLSSSGLADIWLGGRIRLLPAGDPFAATVTLSFKVPTGSPYQSIPLGTGVLDYELSVAGGTGFTVGDSMQGYAQLSGGFRLRNGRSNEFNYLLDAGLNLTPVLLLQGVIDGVLSTSSFPSPPGNDPSVQLFVGDQSFLRWNLGLIYSTADDMELSIGYGRQVAGRNTLASGSLSFGVAWKK
jgi:hypothetical protein